MTRTLSPRETDVIRHTPVIYHGTPLTPRAALLDVCKGRAMCVSFYRPDDVEAVEAISPAIMFRQRRVFVLEAGATQWRGVGRSSGLDAILRVAGASPVSSGAVGSHPRHAGRTFPAQRQPFDRVAIWAAWRAPLAHGWAVRAAATPMRPIRPGLLGLDRAGQEHRLPRVSRTHGGSGQGFREPMAGDPYDARNGGGVSLPLYQCGQHITRTEWMAI